MYVPLPARRVVDTMTSCSLLLYLVNQVEATRRDRGAEVDALNSSRRKLAADVARAEKALQAAMDIELPVAEDTDEVPSPGL
jgi:hypothetical protein